MPSLCEQQLHRLRSLQDEQYLCLSNLEHLEHNLQTMSDAVRCRSFCASCMPPAGQTGFCASCMPPLSQTGRQRHYVNYLSVHLSVHSSVMKLVNTIFWRPMIRFWCRVAQVVHGARAWNDQLQGSGGHVRLKIDLEAWRRHHLDPLGLSRFLFLLLVEDLSAATASQRETRVFTTAKKRLNCVTLITMPTVVV